MPFGNRILIFARYPVPGETKTRLIPVLGPEGAARLHRRMTEKVVATARIASSSGQNPDTGITVCCAGAPLKAFRAWLGGDLEYWSQSSGDIGARMASAVRFALKRSTAAIVVGSDLPFITPATLAQAFESLHEHDIVLGPAEDGGYYLIGMKRYFPELFLNIEWGTARAWNQTCAAVSRLRLTLARLPSLSDVDRPEDLPMLRNDKYLENAFTGKAPLSIIIPTLNEAEGLGRVLRRIGGDTSVEVIVADGGSEDRTREVAEQAGAHVIKAPGGRAAQQNAGAMAAMGPLLLFLHGDTLLPEGYADLIRKALDDPRNVAGAFRFQTDGEGAALRFVEWAAGLRSRFMQAPYGDQGLFMEKRVFEEMGGFALVPIMEDFELVLRLRRRGRVVTLGAGAVTSARRWRQLGVVRTTIINMIMIGGYFCGVSLERLSHLYRVGRKSVPARQGGCPE